MTALDIINSEAFQKCLLFHGHICPGLAIGFRAATAGMAWLDEKRSEDEEIVAIVETDACSADAVQVLTGCTFGKGNFIYKDYGKMALTLLSRNSGQGVRIVLKGETARPDAEHMAQDVLFTIRETTIKLPDRATVEPSVSCPGCGEPVMKSKMEKVGERLLCRGCKEEIGS